MLKSLKLYILVTLIAGLHASLLWAEEPMTKAERLALHQTEAYNPLEQKGLLDGKTIVYRYTVGGWALKVRFYDGMLHYRSVAAPKNSGINTNGPGRKDISYHSRKIGDELYLVSWNEVDIGDQITLVIDFNHSVVHASGLIHYYDQKSHINWFRGAIIQSVTED